MRLNLEFLTGIALTALAWCLFFVVMGMLFRSASWLFCLGYGC